MERAGLKLRIFFFVAFFALFRAGTNHQVLMASPVTAEGRSRKPFFEEPFSLLRSIHQIFFFHFFDAHFNSEFIKH